MTLSGENRPGGGGRSCARVRTGGNRRWCCAAGWAINAERLESAATLPYTAIRISRCQTVVATRATGTRKAVP
jgi:hypothetical protein